MYPPTSRRSLAPAVALLGLLAGACASDPAIAGTWAQSDAQTPLPDVLPVPDGTDLNIVASWSFDAADRFTLEMDLEAIGLTDRMVIEGTYAEDGGQIDLQVEGFVIDAESTNVQTTVEGAPCITLDGFAGTPVCIPPVQTHEYTLGEDTLTVALDHTIAGEEGQTTFTLTRDP